MPTHPSIEGQYFLPYPVGSTSSLIQGYDGPWGHKGKEEYAYDFKMRIGSPVTAARTGVVVAVESKFEDGNRTPGQETFIFVAHGDGTFGRYYHLTKGGVLVALGARVKAGDMIGRSGDTGASAGLHLHFDVTTGCPNWGCQTIPVAIQNAKENPLKADEDYMALPTDGPASKRSRDVRYPSTQRAQHFPKSGR